MASLYAELWCQTSPVNTPVELASSSALPYDARMKNVPILRVAVPSPLYQSFDYLPPMGVSSRQLMPGIRLSLPFGRRELVGVLLEVVAESKLDRAKLRPALELLDDEPILNASLLKLLGWASAYYHHPLGEVVLGVLPKLVRQAKNKQLSSLKTEQVLTSQQGDQNPAVQNKNFVDTDKFNGVKTQHKLALNAAQELAVSRIKQACGFQCFLLDGVTGSGKTEVYLQAMEEILLQGKNALVLVPEIGLTPQLLARFSERFYFPVFSYHSDLSEKQRLETWMAAFNGQARIIIGTRSALFLPLKNLGLIILDEEHDLSFKQQNGFRYSARDCAVMRAQIEHIPIVLGSATPSLESFYNVQRQRYHYLNLPERAGNAVPPQIHLINLRDQQLVAGLSPLLLKRMHEHLEARGQVLLFLNRRGFAPVCLCHHCGWVAECDRCDAKLSLHQKPPRLCCHHCDAVRPVPKQCAHCGNKEIIPVGQGTEQLEQVISELFSDKKVVRMDRDSTRKKGSMNALLAEMQSGAAQILIGTQMLAKGHHFPALTLVALIDADGGLFSTDFRATERLGQLILQVAGRAGREVQAGEVYIQTHCPEHPLLQLLLNQGYPAFMKALLKEREQAALPPFSHLAIVRAEATARTRPLAFLEEIKSQFNTQAIQVLGPIKALMERKAGRFRAHLLLQASRSHLQHELSRLIRFLSRNKAARQVRWSIDVDPQEDL